MDYVIPPTQLFQRTNNVTATEIKFKHQEDQDDIVFDIALYPTGILKEYDINVWDTALLNNLWIGGEYDTNNEKITGKLETHMLNGDLKIYGAKTENGKLYIFSGIDVTSSHYPIKD